MPLHRIRAQSFQMPDQRRAERLAAEAIRLPEGRTLLNRKAEADSALIVVDGSIHVGVIDDDALLGQGEGVLLAKGATYSVKAEADALAFVFSIPKPPGPA